MYVAKIYINCHLKLNHVHKTLKFTSIDAREPNVGSKPGVSKVWPGGQMWPSDHFLVALRRFTELAHMVSGGTFYCKFNNFTGL